MISRSRAAAAQAGSDAASSAACAGLAAPITGAAEVALKQGDTSALSMAVAALLDIADSSAELQPEVLLRILALGVMGAQAASLELSVRNHCSQVRHSACRSRGAALKLLGGMAGFGSRAAVCHQRCAAGL